MPNIVVTGSRTWTDPITLGDALAPFAEHTSIRYELHVGDARGADALAEEIWIQLAGRGRGRRHRADWKPSGVYNPRAGFERNTRMLIAAQPELVIAFRMPGKSNGTDHCIAEAKRLGFTVRTIRP